MFDKLALKYSDKVVYLNSFLKKSREKNGHHAKGKYFDIIPIGTNTNRNTGVKKNIVGHMGLIKESQGLDLLFKNLEDFFTYFPEYNIEIIGTGPEESRYKKMAAKYKDRVTFYGFMEKADEIDKLISRWKVGLATYVPTAWSEHYWGDPSKIKAYIANAVPVITTSVPEFSNEIIKAKAGLVVPYEKNELFNAMRLLIKQNPTYSKNASKLSENYNYLKVYSKLLD